MLNTSNISLSKQFRNGRSLIATNFLHLFRLVSTTLYNLRNSMGGNKSRRQRFKLFPGKYLCDDVLTLNPGELRGVWGVSRGVWRRDTWSLLPLVLSSYKTYIDFV